MQLQREPDEQGQKAVLKLIGTLAQEKEEFQVSGAHCAVSAVLLPTLMLQISLLRSDIKALYGQMAQQYRDAEAQRAAAVTELKTAVAKYQELEATLCTKFVQLLNHKKRKIRTLTEAIREAGPRRTPTRPTLGHHWLIHGGHCHSGAGVWFQEQCSWATMYL